MSKKVLLFASICALGASLVYAADTQVTSKNAVGYISKEFYRGSYDLVQVPFDAMDASYSVTNIFADSLPLGSRVYYWIPEDQIWGMEVYSSNMILQKCVWAPGTNVFMSGEGLFVSIPEDAAFESYTTYFMGEVPSAATTEVVVVEGFSLIGFPYPVAATLTGTVFGAEAKNGDKVYYWTTNGIWGIETYSYNVITQTTNWAPGTLKLEAGMSFFYVASTGTVKNAVRPYSLD